MGWCYWCCGAVLREMLLVGWCRWLGDVIGGMVWLVGCAVGEVVLLMGWGGPVCKMVMLLLKGYNRVINSSSSSSPPLVLFFSFRDDITEGLRWQSRVDGPWTYWKLTDIGRVEKAFVMETMLLLLMLPGNPGLVAGQEIGRVRMIRNLEFKCRKLVPGTSKMLKTEMLFEINFSGLN